MKGLSCDGKDGAFDTITEVGSTKIQDRILAYNKTINEIIGIDMELPEELIEHTGRSSVTTYSAKLCASATTYAFVCSPKKPDKSFSYTIF